jgi:WhiB family redox-sensing transcriptional regulator
VLSALVDNDWVTHARCRGTPVELWFTNEPAALAVAKSICADCVVRQSCLDEALRFEIVDRNAIVGVWGGLSAVERRALVVRCQLS